MKAARMHEYGKALVLEDVPALISAEGGGIPSSDRSVALRSGLDR